MKKLTHMHEKSYKNGIIFVATPSNMNITRM